MAAKIRAREFIPHALDTEYLKLYGVIFVGWLLTSMGTSLFFGGVPFVGQAGLRAVLGVVFGSILWVPGAVILFAGLVATAR